ncbi:MAG: LIC_10190 family membrane protein [Candidatus Acidiferrales bacterium]
MLIVSALAIFFTWVVMAIALLGIGSIFRGLFGRDCFFADAFWMGLCVSTGVLEIWNLFLPITSWATVLLLCAGLLGLLVNRSLLLENLRTRSRPSGWLILSGVSMVLFIAFRATSPCDHVDTGLYGASAVRWILTYPAVPGLANLQGRLGFNSSVFLCIAALGQGMWKDLGHHLFTGFVIAAMGITILPACARVIARSPASPTDWFHSILAIPVFFWAARSRIVGTQTDEPATIACLVAVGIVFDALRRRKEDGERNSETPRIAVATSLFALAVAFKLSTVVFALLTWCLAFRRIWAMSGSMPKRRIYIAGALALSLAILLPWCARGIILSGYPLFPATSLGFAFDWKTPPDVANWYAAGVRAWGRIPDAAPAETRGLAWLGVWSSNAIRNRVSFQVPLAISLGGLAVALGFRMGGKFREACPWLWLLLPSLAGVGFWFLASPDMRFGQFAIWTTAGTLGSWGIVAATSEHRGGQTGAAMAMLLGLLVWCLISFGWKEPYRALGSVKELPALPKADVTVRHTVSGLGVYVPAQGNLCWDAPLPCTPYFDETLRLHKGPSMRWGFASEQRAENLQRYWSSTTR